MFRKASTGILQNLSFGTFIYKRDKVEAQTRRPAGGQAAVLERQRNRHVQGQRLGAVRDLSVHGTRRFQHVLFERATQRRSHGCRRAGFRRDRRTTGNQPTKGETCNAGSYHAGNGRGCPCSERTGLGRRAGRGGPGRTAARQRNRIAARCRNQIWHRGRRHQRVHRQGRACRPGAEPRCWPNSQRRASRACRLRTEGSLRRSAFATRSR